MEFLFRGADSCRHPLSKRVPPWKLPWHGTSNSWRKLPRSCWRRNTRRSRPEHEENAFPLLWQGRPILGWCLVQTVGKSPRLNQILAIVGIICKARLKSECHCRLIDQWLQFGLYVNRLQSWQGWCVSVLVPIVVGKHWFTISTCRRHRLSC